MSVPTTLEPSAHQKVTPPTNRRHEIRDGSTQSRKQSACAWINHDFPSQMTLLLTPTTLPNTPKDSPKLQNPRCAASIPDAVLCSTFPATEVATPPRPLPADTTSTTHVTSTTFESSTAAAAAAVPTRAAADNRSVLASHAVPMGRATERPGRMS